MADMITFPNTVEEFMEQYKITDTEQIYTNGTELVPIFRMKQWFDHKSEKRWIPCSERLPENEDIYLVMFDKSNLLDNETQVTDAYWINNQWQYGVLESYEHRMPKLVVEPIEELKVIAWMPFPEPYKGEES